MKGKQTKQKENEEVRQRARRTKAPKGKKEANKKIRIRAKMDTQRGKNWGYPGNAKKKRKQTGERQIKRQNQTNQHPEQPENKAVHKQDSIQQPAWVLNAAGAIAMRSITLFGKRTKRKRHYTKEHTI